MSLIVDEFLKAALVPRDGSSHAEGTLERALELSSQIPAATIHVAATLGDEDAVRIFLQENPTLATATGGPYNWDALTHLSFSRFLRLDDERSDAFVRTARLLLDAGASANTGWYEEMEHPTPHRMFESAIYGAAAVARHAGLTKLLLEYGADPNDDETPYHVPESYDNTIARLLMESGKLTAESLTTILIRKTDWHDEDGLQLALDYAADPNFVTRWGNTALHHAVLRDNSGGMIERLLRHGGRPDVVSTRSQLSVAQLAARRGRGDLLRLFARYGFSKELSGVDELIARCALGEATEESPGLRGQVIAWGGTLLAQFAGNGNDDGLRSLLALGILPNALYAEGDAYFDEAKNSTALHVAAWRARPVCVRTLIAAGAPVNALDGRGRTALQMAVKATVNSFWTARRNTESIAALLAAGASTQGIVVPTGYDEADAVLRAARESARG